MSEPGRAPHEVGSIWWVPASAAGTDRPLSRHLWTPVTWNEARGWPDARLRTVCGLVIPRAVLPGAPGSSDASASERAAEEPLRLCQRCARIQQARAARET